MQKILKLALTLGFTSAAPMNMEALVFRPEVRDMCAANRCGKYGTLWTCPPACGTLEELAEKARGYLSGVLVQTTGALEDDFDFEGMQDVSARHAAAFRAFSRELVAQMGADALWAMGAGGCGECETCAYPDAPCRHPELAAPSMEACGLVVSDVCRACNIPYKYGDRTITYVSCVLFKAEKPVCKRELVTLASDGVRAVVDPLGAQLVSFVDERGIERVWEGDPAVWGEHAPVLFPVAGGFLDDYYTLDGKTYHMPKHGFAKECLFTVELQSANAATFLLTREHPGFPFPYAFRVRFSLDGNALTVQYITDNPGDKTLYFGLGAHEGYACPGGVERYSVVFDEPETLEASVLAGSQITHDTDLMLENARTLALKREHFEPDALVFLSVQSRGCELRENGGGRALRVDFTGFDSLLLWTKPGAPYLCIEPWCNPPEFTDHDHDITKKPGVIALAPGARDIREHTITLL